MDPEGGDPSAVNKNPKIIRAAQEDINRLDVLVCGLCRHVFHFIDDFKDHKDNKDCKQPTFKANLSETKPQVWAFLLWKSAVVAQQKPDDNKENLNSWKLYQKWCKMDESVRNSWIAAGKTIQTFSNLANAKLQEVHKTQSDRKTPIKLNQEESDSESTLPDSSVKLEKSKLGHSKKVMKKYSNLITRNDGVRDTLEERNKIDPSVEDLLNENEVGKELSTSSSDMKDAESNNEKEENIEEMDVDKESEKQDKVETGENGNASSGVKKGNIDSVDAIEIKEEKLSEEECLDDDMDKTNSDFPKPVESREGSLFLKKTSNKPVSQKVMRPNINKDPADDGSSEDEYVVEKILAKRFNPRRKYYEYLLKWEGYPHDQNTWEPVHNMAACDKLVETFERNLARQKAAQQQKITLPVAGSNQKFINRVPKPHIKGLDDLALQTGSSASESSRPVRSSKKKALAQVKSWCGSMAKKSDSEMGGKRKAGEDSDSEDDISLPDKKVKLEPLDDDEWSDGGASSASSAQEDREKRAAGNFQNKLLPVSRNKEQYLMSSVVKRSPGRPRKRVDESAVNGVTISKNKKEESNDLAVKLGLESDSSPEHKSKSQPNSAKGSNSNPPVLVANSKGVIKVDPRQVPNLTSGVYIVSNKSGVVKLESVPGSPTKGKVTPTSQGSREPNKTVMTQSGIIRKPVSLSPGVTRVNQSPGQTKVLGKPGMPVRPGLSPGLVRMSPTNTQFKSLAPRMGGPRAPLTSPRVLGPRMPGGTRPVSLLSSRPGLNNSIRPALSPRTPNLIRTPMGVKKSPIGIPGVQTKIMRAVSPRLQMQGGKIMSSLSAQTRSGVKPIQAMLGKAVQGNAPLTDSAGNKKLGDDMKSSLRTNFDDDDEEEDDDDISDDDRLGGISGRDKDNSSKQRDSKLVDSDSLHMEFQEMTSDESESDDSLPELPMGDLPSLEPDSPPRPFTLCPETGKILGRAEGEPTPPPTPEPRPPEENDQVPREPPTEEMEPEEILPDPRPASPLHYRENNKETLLKVEMSPGGTTGTVVESNPSEHRNYMDTLRTEQGLTVTKIADSGTKNGQQLVTTSQVVTQVKAGGGISVPARKLFVDTTNSGKLGTDIVTVTGEDGVVYQISTEGQQVTEEGGQQCVYVSTEQSEGGDEGAVLTLDTAVAEAVAQLIPDQVGVIGGAGCSQFFIKEGEEPNVEEQQPPQQQLVMASMVGEGAPEDSQGQVVAHVVQEGELDPLTGKRRVVLLLPDGNLMMTEVDEEQYAALNLEEK